MFEQESEMEKRSSSVVTLMLGVVGAAAYFTIQSRKILSPAEANSVVAGVLDNQGPIILRFQSGIVKGSDNPHDPQYRLLEKAGYLRIGKDLSNWKTPISLTPKGETFLAGIAGVKRSKNKDGIDEYAVPLARRKLVEINKITMLTASKALVEYTWKWENTQASELLDAAGPAVKAFNTSDRSTRIDKLRAPLYHHAPAKVTMALIKTARG